MKLVPASSLHIGDRIIPEPKRGNRSRKILNIRPSATSRGFLEIWIEGAGTYHFKPSDPVFVPD